jgi:hypothetical protein
MSALASAFSTALGRGEPTPTATMSPSPASTAPSAATHTVPTAEPERQERPERARESVVERPGDARPKPKPAPAVKADGEFVSGPHVERAQRAVSAWIARTGGTSKDVATKVGWSASHIDQLLAGKKKYLPVTVAAALVALERER